MTRTIDIPTFQAAVVRNSASTHGKSCCSDGAVGKKAKRAVVTDADESHYPYSDELLIGGMSCDGCAQNVANALNALDGVWATVTYADHAARVRSKRPIDREALGRGLFRYETVGAALSNGYRPPVHWGYRHPKICAKINQQMRQKWSLVTVCAEFATNRAPITPSKNYRCIFTH